MRLLAAALAVGRKELRQIGRDRRTLMILLLVPALFLLLYGYALSFDIRDVPLAVLDGDRSRVSREVVSAFVNSGYFNQVAELTDDAAIVDLIDRNQARAVLVLPASFGRDARAGRHTAVQLIVDGDNANTATTVVGYGLAIVSALSARYELQGSARPPGGALVTVEPRIWYNPELRSALFLVPGLIAYIAMLTAVVSAALSIVREKEAGTMEQVRMSPIPAAGYVLGRTIPYFFVSLASSILILLLAMLLFDLPMRGSWVLLLASVSLFLVGALAWGLLISTVAPNQQVAFQVALLSSFLPTIMLSGFIFPIASMPAALQVVTYVVPARYFLVALRAVVLKGAGFEVIGGQLLALATFATVVIGFAALRLRKEWA